MSRFDDSDEEFYGDDDDVYAEMDDDSRSATDDEPTVACPNCGYEMLEIAHQCLRCGEIPTREFVPRSTQPRWVILTALLLLGIMLFCIFGQ